MSEKYIRRHKFSAAHKSIRCMQYMRARTPHQHTAICPYFTQNLHITMFSVLRCIYTFSFIIIPFTRKLIFIYPPRAPVHIINMYVYTYKIAYVCKNISLVFEENKNENDKWILWSSDGVSNLYKVAHRANFAQARCQVCALAIMR